jgi:hypothetical protein
MENIIGAGLKHLGQKVETENKKNKKINQGLTKENVTDINHNLKQRKTAFSLVFPVARYGCHTDN